MTDFQLEDNVALMPPQISHCTQCQGRVFFILDRIPVCAICRTQYPDYRLQKITGDTTNEPLQLHPAKRT